MATTNNNTASNPAYNYVMRMNVTPYSSVVSAPVEKWRTESVPIKVRPVINPWMVFKWLFRGYVDADIQLDAKHALALYDNPDYGEPADHMTGGVQGCDNVGEEGLVVARKPRRDNASWWTVYSLLAHAEFNSPDFTRANEMVVSTWIRKQMHEDGVTRVDTARVLGLAVRMAFVPTEADVLALQYSAAPAIRRREDAFRASYWTAWWGRPIARTRP